MAKLTRQKILDTTSRLLERQGYHATGLNQIVKESTTPRGSLYYYFPEGKEELAAEAVTQRMQNMADYSRRFLSKTDDPAEAIYAMIVDISQKMAAQGCCTGAPIAAVALEASNTSERIRIACAEGYQTLQDVIAEKLRTTGVSAERAETLAITINAAIEGAMILSRTKQDAGTLGKVAGEMKVFLQNAIGS